jgi:hypothetical protein
MSISSKMFGFTAPKSPTLVPTSSSGEKLCAAAEAGDVNELKKLNLGGADVNTTINQIVSGRTSAMWRLGVLFLMCQL